MRKEDLLGEWVEHFHDVGAAGDGAHRQPTANHLAERGEVGRRPAIPTLRPLVGAAKGDDLVEDQQRAVVDRPAAERLDVPRGSGDDPHAVRQRVDQHAGQFATVIVQDRHRGLRVVERDDDHVGAQGTGVPRVTGTLSGWRASPQFDGLAVWLTSA